MAKAKFTKAEITIFNAQRQGKLFLPQRLGPQGPYVALQAYGKDIERHPNEGSAVRRLLEIERRAKAMGWSGR